MAQARPIQHFVAAPPLMRTGSLLQLIGTGDSGLNRGGGDRQDVTGKTTATDSVRGACVAVLVVRVRRPTLTVNPPAVEGYQLRKATTPSAP